MPESIVITIPSALALFLGFCLGAASVTMFQLMLEVLSSRRR